MSGEELRLKLESAGIKVGELGKRLGYNSHQATAAAFSVADVKTGLIEKIAKEIDRPVSWFFQSDGSRTATASGNGIAVAGDNNNNHFASHEELMRTYMDAILQCVKSMEKVVEGLAAK